MMKSNEQLIKDITQVVLHQLQPSKNVVPTENKSIKVGVSARHIHLSKEHVEILFGEGYELQPFKELMGGQYAAKECVTLIGTKLRAIEKVRILGPVRKSSQVEVSATDAIRLGIRAPLRASGDTKGSAPIIIVGPKGVVHLEEGCIMAWRHIHMSPEDAKNFGVKDKEIVDVQIQGDRGGVMSEVLVRVDPTFTLEMHIDTDEANGMGIACGTGVSLIRRGCMT